MNNIIGLYALIIVILLVMQFSYNKFSNAKRLLNGFWQAPVAFCKKSGVDSIQFYIQGSSMYFLVLSSDRQPIMNKCIGFSKSYNWSESSTEDSMIWDITFDDDVSPFPQECQMRFDIDKIMLHFIKDETLYLEAFRNNAVTAGIL